MHNRIQLLSFISALWIGLFSTPTFAVGTDCNLSLQAEVNRINQEQDGEYRALSSASASAGIRPGNEARLLLAPTGENAKNSAVILIHGFAASPFEVQDLGDHLANQGYTVYLPLLPGFGSTAFVANQYGSDQWKEKLEASVKLMSRCYTELSLVGFSTGGTLVADYLLAHPETRIRAAALLSPFFENAKPIPRSLQNIITRFTPAISASRLWRFTRNPDLGAILRFPEHYNFFVPLFAAREVINLGSEVLKGTPENAQSRVPVLLAYSETDQTISTFAANQFVLQHFERTEKTIFSHTLRVPHQIALPEVNPYASGLFSNVAEFLDRHTRD